MRGIRLIWQLIPSYLLVTVVSVAAITWFASVVMHRSYLRQTGADLEARAHLLAARFLAEPTFEDEGRMDELCKELGRRVEMRITLILPSGRVIGDSERKPTEMDNHSDRLEFIGAMDEGVGRSERMSDTLGRRMMYVAVPVIRDEKMLGVARVSLSISFINHIYVGVYLKIIVVGIVVVVLAALVSLIISRRITKPLYEIRQSAERFASGDLSIRDYTPSSREIDALAQAMNKMAGQLNADMTRLRHLENMRRDFVANVSHELRTPITTIKGFVETLLDGAMKNPEEARRFLDIVARHADRLNAIIEDLLVLSRIEQGTGENDITFENVLVGDVLVAAVQTCERKAMEKQINIEMDCDQTITARVNPVLLEQAVVNLGDNAIKYSELGSRVSIKVVRELVEIVITVSDSGCGIAEEHLPRLFERFYRFD